jgi:hypothetical protein
MSLGSTKPIGVPSRALRALGLTRAALTVLACLLITVVTEAVRVVVEYVCCAAVFTLPTIVVTHDSLLCSCSQDETIGQRSQYLFRKIRGKLISAGGKRR